MISRTKLKVMLSAEDMKKLDFDPCAGGDLSGRAAFRNILKEARDKCGFDAIGERVFVQYYPEKHGGCEMFVTKLAADEKSGAKQAEERSLHTNVKKDGYILYRFDKLDGVLTFCSALKKRGYEAGSEFFVVEENIRKYYLMLGEEETSAGEFGGAPVGKGGRYYISEHGRRICADAVNVLGSLAKN